MSDHRIRALIVDDEPLARSLLREMLAAHADIEVAGEAAGGRAALERLEEGDIDLLFLDIEMPGLNGFDLVASMTADATAQKGVPAIIFVTAFDQYALDAFDVHALDYLLKPFDEDRLARSLQRARVHLQRVVMGDETQRILALLEALNRRESYPDRLPIKQGDRTFLQPLETIDWIEANGKHVNVHVGKDTHVIRDTMAQVSEALDPERFVRISRSAIVNVARIREIQPWFRGEYVVLLHSGAQVPSTRAFRDNLSRLLDRRR